MKKKYYYSVVYGESRSDDRFHHNEANPRIATLKEAKKEASILKWEIEHGRHYHYGVKYDIEIWRDFVDEDGEFLDGECLEIKTVKRK